MKKRTPEELRPGSFPQLDLIFLLLIGGLYVLAGADVLPVVIVVFMVTVLALVLGIRFGVFVMANTILRDQDEAEGHDFELLDLKQTEEITLRFADAYVIVRKAMSDADGDPHTLDQDYMVSAFNALDSAVNGEERCVEPEEFKERRRAALAVFRHDNPAEGDWRNNVADQIQKGGAAE